MFQFFSLIFALFIISGCDVAEDVGEDINSQYDLADNYPSAKPGSAEITGRSLTDIAGDDSPIMFAINSGCRLLTSPSSFGKHSLELVPKSISCPDGAVVTVKADQISNAYIDKRYFDYTEMPVTFQVYDTTILAPRISQ